MGEWGILVQKREGERSRRSCRSLGSYLQARGTFVTCVVACEQSRVNFGNNDWLCADGSLS